MRPTRLALVLGLFAASLGAATPAVAPAATAGQTFLASGMPLPAGAIAGGNGGLLAFGDPDKVDRVSVSADGRFVAFVATADALDPAADADVTNVFRKDRDTGAVVLVSRANGPNGDGASLSSEAPAISDDGSKVAFRTASALVPGDTDAAQPDVYVRDLDRSTTTLASAGNDPVQPVNGVGTRFDLSGDGRFVAFSAISALVTADQGSTEDVYRRDLQGGATATVLVSASTGGRGGNAASQEPSISDDGRWVAFVSDATDLVSGFAAGTGLGRQVFARDVTARATLLVSASRTSRTRGSDDTAKQPDVAGGSDADPASVKVAFQSFADDLGAGSVPPDSGVYVRRMSDSTPVLVASAGALDSVLYNDPRPSISDDGTLVVFGSSANLGAGLGTGGVYVARPGTPPRLVSTDNEAARAGAIADDGSFIAWAGLRGVTADSDPNLGGVFGRTFVLPASLGPVQYVSRPPGGAPFLSPALEVRTPDAGDRTISADGRYVVVKASDSRLPGFAAGRVQIYRRDLLTGATELVSRADGANGAPAAADLADAFLSVSADGTRVAFTTDAPLSQLPTSGSQAWVRDLAAGTTTLVSRAGRTGPAADRGARDVAISADGTHVAFASAATNLGGPAGTVAHVYLRDLAGASTQLIDRAGGSSGLPGDGDVDAPALSRDGRFVAFASNARNLDPNVRSGQAHVYVRDTVAGATTLVSRRSGAAGALAAGISKAAAISADGRLVVFETSDERLAPEAGAWGGSTQVVARDLVTQQNTLVSRAPGGAPAAGGARVASVSGDGGVIAFESAATNLVPGVGGLSAVFARSMATGALSAPPAFGVVGDDAGQLAQRPSISDDGQCLAFVARGHNAVSGTAGDFLGVYVHAVSGQCPKLPQPPPGPPPGPPGPPAPPARGAGPAKPALSRVSLLHKRFRVGRAATARAAATKRRTAKAPPVGSAFRFTLNAAAQLSIALERAMPGRRVGRACRRPSARLRRRPRCDRFTNVATLMRSGVRAGAGSVAFSGRVGRRALKPGRYRARLRAANAAGASSVVTVAFEIASAS